MRYLNFLLLLISVNAWSFFLPIPGVGDLIKAGQQIALLKQQLLQMKKQVKDVESHYQYANLLGPVRDHHWAPDSWDSALHNLSGGNTARYQQLYLAYQKKHHFISMNQYEKGASQSLAVTYKDQMNATQAAGTMADLEYQTLNKHIAHVDKLSRAINATVNIKAATDLNSSLTAELSYIAVEELRMQTLLNHQLAQGSVEKIQSSQREAIFNQLPKEKP
jgi:type IV secretion system protein VirB5